MPWLSLRLGKRAARRSLIVAERFESRTLLTSLVTSTDEIQLSEAHGSQVEVNLRLSQAPISTVSFQAKIPSNDFSVSTETVTFSPENWHLSQTIVIQSIDDLELEGTENHSLIWEPIDVSPTDDSSQGVAQGVSIDVKVIDFENEIFIHGTNNSDTFAFSAEPDHFKIEFNDQTFEVTSNYLLVEFDGLAGNDHSTIQGTSAIDIVTVSPFSAKNYGTNYQVVVNHSETIEVVSNGGPDLASLRGSTGDDTLVTSPQETIFGNGKFETRIHGFPAVVVRTNGGQDTAEFLDSPGTDTYIANPGYAYLSGPGFYNIVLGFAQTSATSTLGGNDVAAFYDSSGDETVSLSPLSTQIYGDTFQHTANGFRSTRAYAVRGGYDAVEFVDGVGDDLFVSKTEHSYISNDAYFGLAQGFDLVEATATSGNDVAQFYGQQPNGWFGHQQQTAVHAGDRQIVVAEGFGSVADFTTRSIAAPYGSVAGFDRELLAISRSIQSGGEIPDDFRFAYPKALQEFRNSNSTAELAASLKLELDEHLATDQRGHLFRAIGYHELIPVTGEVHEQVAAPNTYLTLTDRFGLESRIRTLPAITVGKNEPKGTVVLLHGTASIPEYLAGDVTLSSGEEYHRLAAVHWQAAGYDVLIPELQGSSYFDLQQLGYSFVGVETARVIDLLHAVGQTTDSPIVLAGISRGATIAEAAGVLSKHVDVTVSIGGALRREADARTPFGNSEFLREFRNRNLVVSAALGDTYQGWSLPEAVGYSQQLKREFHDSGGELRTVFFDGYHEIWAAGEIQAVGSILNV